jgi:hypothetical protein
VKFYNIFLKALRSALWGDDFDYRLEPAVFQRVMEIAEEQVVAGLVFDVLSRQDTKIGLDATINYIAQNEQIKNSNDLINNELISFVESANNNKFDCLIVKGQTIGRLYSNLDLRASGDIDILMLNDYSDSKIILERMMGVVLPEKMIEKELSFFYGETRFDVHRNIVDFCCSKHQRFWDELLKKKRDCYYFVDIKDVKVRTLPPTINVVYVFLHLFFHFIREGVALRQFCDWAMALHHYKDEIDRNKRSDILDGIGVKRAFCAFGSVSVDYLGLPKDEFPLVLNDKDRCLSKTILQDVFKGGNFGRKNHQSKSTLGYKFETMRLIIKNNIRYYKLAPSEMRMMVPKMIGINIKLLFG